MKFLHTADWHLGKIFMEYPLINDQEHMLNQILCELKKESENKSPYDALLIAGDVYDRAVPPAEAVTLLGKFIAQTHSQLPTLHIFLSAGNHDSAERLSFLKEPLDQENIHICTDCEKLTEPVVVNGTCVYQIPFLTSGSVTPLNPLPEDKPFLRTQQELLDEAAAQILSSHSKNHAGKPAVLSAHLFAKGSLTGDSERSSVGTADVVGTESLSSFAYVALGHIHSKQHVANNVWYSGSPLAYSFREQSSSKVILSVCIKDDGTAEVSGIPITPLHPCTTIRDSFKNVLQSPEYDKNKDDLLNVICTDSTTIINPMQQLRTRFPNTLNFSYAENEARETNASIQARRELLKSKDEKSTKEIFKAFLTDLYGKTETEESELRQKEISLFEERAKKLEEEA